ncbi:hypothetical protein LZ31DRAFT_338426 [Colletotrichum somersetense]|nr:hypothetical protein LZ31DRAFT_338426 [Colletotrichum somersetense]
MHDCGWDLAWFPRKSSLLFTTSIPQLHKHLFVPRETYSYLRCYPTTTTPPNLQRQRVPSQLLSPVIAPAWLSVLVFGGGSDSTGVCCRRSALRLSVSVCWLTGP